MKYSILLPFHDPHHEKITQFSKLVTSVAKNISTDDYELVIVKDGPSYVESHNLALKHATGDYLIILNDDIEIQDKEFIEKFTSDTVIKAWKETAHAWGMSRKIFEKVGYFDERFKNGFNCEDTDYFHRSNQAGFPIEDADVNLIHKSNNKSYAERSINKAIFEDKWGFKP